MPESNQISRKRMRFSSSSASEILITSKAQHQRHHRSGRIESHTGDGLRFNHSPSVTGKITPRVLRTYPRVTIKDLRLRRVFTPSSIWEFKTKEQPENHHCDSNIGEEGSKVDAGGLGNEHAKGFLKTTPNDSDSVPICEEISGSVVRRSGTNVCHKPVIRSCSRSKIFKNPGSFSYKRLLPYLMQAADVTPSGQPEQNPPNVSNEENVEVRKEEASELMKAECQLPEPTKDVVAQSVDGLISKYFASGNVSSPLKKVETTKAVAQSVDGGVINKHSAVVGGNTSPLKKVIASSPIKKSASCSRRKLFKTPGSVNYRRMLPYLKDIQEDNPCVPETVNHPDNKKNTEESTPASMLVSENEGTEDIMVTSDVAREPDTCPNEEKELVPCEVVSASPDTDKEQETQVKHVIPDTEKNLGTPQNALGSEVQFSSPISAGSGDSSEVAALSALNNIFVENLAVVGEEIMKTDAKNSGEQLDSDSTAELLDTCAVSGTPTSISPSKGILKRSIRGCRGVCSCLNCSSFRLNAERAFEFSRNQLQDTEVMVLDLVGEISHLREMLEKYNSADHNESYKLQAGEAAKRASEAAELAKSRLYQMNDDLQVHCRIPNEQRAKVKFAHYVHEKTILEASSQSTQLDS